MRGPSARMPSAGMASSVTRLAQGLLREGRGRTTMPTSLVAVTRITFISSRMGFRDGARSLRIVAIHSPVTTITISLQAGGATKVCL